MRFSFMLHDMDLVPPLGQGVTFNFLSTANIGIIRCVRKAI